MILSKSLSCLKKIIFNQFQSINQLFWFSNKRSHDLRNIEIGDFQGIINNQDVLYKKAQA